MGDVAARHSSLEGYGSGVELFAFRFGGLRRAAD